MRFKGRVAIVTGSGQGIGLATARAFIKEGAIVVMNDIDRDLLHNAVESIECDGQAVPFVADVVAEDQVNNMVSSTFGDHGRIDILVNNVGGVFGAGITIEDSTLETWQKTIDWNLTSQYLCCKAVIPIMKEQKYGRILNISTDAAFRGTMTDDIAYPAAKAGVVGLTNELARYLGMHGITVNVICPGDTITETFYQQIEEGLWPETIEEHRERHSVENPLGRAADPAEIADGILFLASEDASYITGDVLHITGGFHLSQIPAGGRGGRVRSSGE